MKRILTTLTLLFLPFVLLAQGDNNRAEWRFSKKQTKSAKSYLSTGCYSAAIGIEGAQLSFCPKSGKSLPGLNESGYPTALSKGGDYWLLEIPVTALDAGTVVDVFLPFIGNEGERNDFVLEYRDGKRWVEAVQAQSTTSHKHPERLWQSVRFGRAVRQGEKLSLRLRQIEKGAVQSAIACPSPHGQRPQVVIYDNSVPRDTLKMLFIGNSYTYYHTYPMIFKEIAWREGHYADCNIFISGGYTMKAHLANEHSMAQVDKGGYNCVMLQDQSILPTLNGTEHDAGSSGYVGEMVKRVMKSSPNAKVSLEITWGRRFGNNNFGKYDKYVEIYPHFYADYDAMQNRLIEVTTAEANEWGTMLTPVGLAWQIVMHERPDIMLYHTDNHHQSYAGAYLSAAVAYLTVYGEKFGQNPADCRLDSDTAAYLRAVAERVVLSGERWSEK